MGFFTPILYCQEGLNAGFPRALRTVTGNLSLPVDLTLLFKALVSLEGLGRPYPELIERVKPFLDRAMRERYQPAEAARRAQETLSD